MQHSISEGILKIDPLVFEFIHYKQKYKYFLFMVLIYIYYRYTFDLVVWLIES